MKKKRNPIMETVLTIVLVVAGWLLLTRVVLPKLGVPT